MRKLCKQPISTGIMDRKATYDPCDRPLFKQFELCKYHAAEAGLIPNICSANVIAKSIEARKRTRAANKAAREAALEASGVLTGKAAIEHAAMLRKRASASKRKKR